MFRKVPKKRKTGSSKARIRSGDDDDDNSDDEEATSIHQRIQQTQKKHKLLASLPMTTGEANDKPGGKKRRFLSVTDESKTNADMQHDMSVLDQKHQQAMEEFIKGKLDPSANEEEKEASDKAANTSSIDPETALYQELAASTVPSQVLNASMDDDKDAKGAMLVGGTGIAEVILPKAATFDNNKNKAAGVRYSRNPHLSSAVGGGASTTAKSDSKLLPAGFRSMVPANKDQSQDPELRAPHPLSKPLSYPNETFQSSDKADGTDKDKASAATTTNEPLVPPTKSDDVDESRPGFASRKGGKPASAAASATSTTNNTKPRGHQYQRDHAVFSKFVKRERGKR
jgi:hypothetical protein